MAAIPTSPAAPVRRALAFGGGGVLGFAWTVGAVAAYESITGRDARDAEIVLGTSAGAVLGSLLGCRLSVDVISRHHQGVPALGDPAIGYDHDRGAGEALPARPGWRPASPRVALGGVRPRRRVPPIVALSGLLPAGRGSLAPVHELVGSVAAAAGFADTWPSAPRPWVVVVDYRTGARIVFGRDRFAPPAAGVARVVRTASLADAVTASCSIPAWYPPAEIGAERYIDGGTVSNASLDVLRGTGIDEVAAFVPMASVDPGRPKTRLERVERMFRRAITKRVLADVEALRADGMRVHLITPAPEDLAVMGVNLMNPAHRVEVLETARETAAAQMRRQFASPLHRRSGHPANDPTGRTA